MLRVGVLVSGGGTNLQAIIDALKVGRITNTEIVTVISNNPNAYALERGKTQGIDVACISPKDYACKADFTAAMGTYLDQMKVDLVVLAGYLVVLEKAFIQQFRHRIINIHPSLIPAFSGKGFYGLKVHEAALQRGVKVAGATVHFVDEGTDTGPIIAQKTVQVLEDDTAKTLQLRVMEEAEWQLLPEAIDLIANKQIFVKGHLVKRLKAEGHKDQLMDKR